MARTRNAGGVLLAVVVVTAALAGGVSATSVVTASGTVSVPGSTSAASSSSAAIPVTHGCSFPFSSTDATGTEVTVEEEPERIVTLNPSAAQTMWEIGARDKVVGVSKYAMYLEGAEAKTNISGSGRTAVVVEKVVALEPDLVLAPNTIQNETVSKLRESGLTVYRFEFASSIDDVKRKTELTGQIVGACDGAHEAVERMDRELSTVESAVEGQDRPRVLYVFFGYTAGEGTFIHEMIEFAGGENVAAEANITGYQQISDEVVVDRNPEWIVLNGDNPNVPQTEAYNGTTAVEQDNVLVLNASYVSQPAPRIIRPIVKMAKAFHPETYAAANETATPTPTDTETATVAETPTAESTPTAVDGPGFGLAAGLAGIVLALALGRRD